MTVTAGPEDGPSWWTARRAAAAKRRTARRQRRTDRRQVARGRRVRARAQRRGTRARRWAAFKPYALAAGWTASASAAGFSTGLIWGTGVGLVMGFGVTAVALVAFEWRVHGE